MLKAVDAERHAEEMRRSRQRDLDKIQDDQRQMEENYREMSKF